MPSDGSLLHADSQSARLRKPEQPAEVRYTGNDRRRLFALARLFAAEAGFRPDVISFREAVLGDADATTEQVEQGLEALKRFEESALANAKELDVEAIRVEMKKLWNRRPGRAPVCLSDDLARSFVQSPLAQCLALEDFRAYGISPARHSVRTWTQSTAAGRHPIRQVLLREPDLEIHLQEDMAHSVYRVMVGGSPPRERAREAGGTHRLSYPLPKGGQGMVDVWPGSVLDGLSHLARDLARCYYWNEADAVWFVLTGAMPAVRGLDISVYRNAAEDSVDSYVEIRMLPWIDPDTVRAAIIGFRRDLARAGRAIGDRGFRLVDFVISRARPDIAPNDRLWKRLHREWNECHGTKDEFRNAADLRAAYYAARDSLLRKSYR